MTATSNVARPVTCNNPALSRRCSANSRANDERRRETTDLPWRCLSHQREHTVGAIVHAQAAHRATSGATVGAPATASPATAAAARWAAGTREVDVTRADTRPFSKVKLEWAIATSTA
jgi:hypothetical protein